MSATSSIRDLESLPWDFLFLRSGFDFLRQDFDFLRRDFAFLRRSLAILYALRPSRE
jgi:hypothetical protein